uniref:estradiol 17-beta-dehydrogenase 8-like isoform X1 n=1 Tax=Styela clava TaxID=7725 RepID=UPI00193A1935|nr:estradiol 17-beta-dehydrogenase 8-like isoform X1 [Styela clava]
MSQGRLAGQCTIVTGGSSGIGRAICQVFAKEGASVAVLGRNIQRLSETINTLPTNHGNKHCLIQADVSSAEQVARAFKESTRQLGKKITILVNNAGITRNGFIDEFKNEDFDEMMGINLKGYFLMSSEFVKLLSDVDKNQDFCCIVNVSSMFGIRGFPSFAGYSATKSGIIGLTKCVASEYSKHKIRCNAVLPGMIQTPMNEGVPESFKENIAAQTPMQRLGKPEEVANACLFLASNESSYVNGACLEVAGGFLG